MLLAPYLYFKANFISTPYKCGIENDISASQRWAMPIPRNVDGTLGSN